MRGAIALRTPGGLEACVLTLGATLARLRVPDRRGDLGDVVLGFDDPAGWVAARWFGASVGRYANRIAGARFRLDGREWRLVANEGRHHLHGGARGTSGAVWEVADRAGGAEPSVRLRHVSPDGDEGYPGRLEAHATYTLSERGALRIDYEAACDAPTVVNLVSHAYFHLGDGGASPVLDHELQVFASRYTPVDREGIPTGEIAPVAGTPLDFTRPRRIGERLSQLVPARGGYDHNFVLDAGGGSLAQAALLREESSGRVLRVHTTQPGLQLYTGNFLDGSLVGRGGVRLGRWHGVCLEAQRFPDTPNRPAFGSAVLRPGERYRETTLCAFGIEA